MQRTLLRALATKHNCLHHQSRALFPRLRVIYMVSYGMGHTILSLLSTATIIKYTGCYLIAGESRHSIIHVQDSDYNIMHVSFQHCTVL